MVRYISIFLVFFFISCEQRRDTLLKRPDQLDDGIKTATLKEAGVKEGMIKAMQDSVTAGVYPNIHSVLIFRNGKLVYENYWPGHDENRGTGFTGMINHGRDSLHDIRSITKSVVSAAVMIAIDQGKIKSLDQRVFDFFPEYAMYDTGIKRNTTIQHLLNMSTGLEWHEDLTYVDSMKIRSADDAIGFVLSQSSVNAPGSKFKYSSGSTQVLAAIVEKNTGMTIEEFAAKFIFQPLGIKDYEWTKERNGIYNAWAGLRMRSRDMLKFGILYLDQGKWKGKQVLPVAAVEQTLRIQVNTGEQNGYSNQFWILKDTIPGESIVTVEASGNGGQKIEINKVKNLLLVITAGNYDADDLKKWPYDLYMDFVWPAGINEKKN